jgi:hypothetical protein
MITRRINDHDGQGPSRPQGWKCWRRSFGRLLLALATFVAAVAVACSSPSPTVDNNSGSTSVSGSLSDWQAAVCMPGMPPSGGRSIVIGGYGAPNVLIVLIDDVGFGASSAFGGPYNTPTAERLAANGLKLNRFHTTALCSPTRQALLTGRNHHSVGMGGITEGATSAPGNSSVRPKDKAPIAETLRLNGYSTAQFGKCHEVPVWEVSPGQAEATR